MGIEENFPTSERMSVNLPVKLYILIDALAEKHDVTLSWVCRVIMRNPMGFRLRGCRRPRYLAGEHYKFQICTYGDKNQWRLLMIAKSSEFGPYFRALFELYLPHIDKLDFEADRFNKSIDVIQTTRKHRRYTSVFPIGFIRYKRREYWPKNPVGNIWLREWGISNRGPKNPIIRYYALKRYIDPDSGPYLL